MICTTISEGAPGIYVSPDGRVFKEVKKWEDSDGYQYVTVNRKHHAVHRLVAKCFVPGETKETPVVCHKDDNPRNNNYKNLEWGTYSKNTYDAYARGRKTKNIHVRCMETGEIFYFAREACRKMFGDPKKAGHVLEAIRREKGTAYGYHWEAIPR